MGDRLASIDMGRKLAGVLYTLFCGGAASPSNTMSPEPRPYLRTKWHLGPSSGLAKIDMGRKFGAVSLLGKLGPI